MDKLDDELQLLKDLTDAKAVPGNEREAREVMKKYITPYADEVTTDRLGSLIATKKGTGDPKIMVAGHLDEVGFMVTQIDSRGFLKFQTLGGWWSQVMLAQRVTVVTGKGEEITGVIGSKPPHILPAEARKKPADIKDMFIDIGAQDKEEAESFGVRPGDMVVPYCEFTVMKNPKYLMAKAFDNRAGCAVAVEVLKHLKNDSHPNTVYGVGTVQEEVLMRGATTSAFQINPDIGLTVDTGIPADTPGVTEKDAQAVLGEGPQICIYDAMMVTHAGLRDFVTDIADKEGIPYQFDTTPGGGTDAGKIHLNGKGVPSIAINIPTRYLHSSASIIHRDDFENTVKLVLAVIKKLDAEAVERITYV